MEDADLDKAAELAVTGATKNSGQRCTAVKRILCVEAVADAFSELVLKKAKKLKCGDPMDPGDRRRHRDPRGRGEVRSSARVVDAVDEGREAAARQRPAGRALSADRGRSRARMTASWCTRRRSAR
jgi:acyl-CoA reductase-like NAD-dependent aldehyde dehydrogenase